MQTYQEQLAFFESNWPGIKAALERDGAPGAIDHIRGFDDDLERRVLFVFARQGLVLGEWQGKGFDPYIEVADAGIAELLRQADAAEDDATRAARTNGAHIVSFNLAADLADCWPGDDTVRTTSHYERGVKAAEDCVSWCDPANLHGLSNDWWVKGMHELSLARNDAALASWTMSWDLAKQGAASDGGTMDVTPEASFGLLLLAGYTGIAQARAGEPDGEKLLEDALGAFRAQLEDTDRAGDAQFGIDQLEKVRGSYL